MKAQHIAAWCLGLAVVAGASLAPTAARACGGFFCSSTPVDQNAERVVFKIRGDGRTDMIVQITYQGKAEDFAWLLPLAEPPTKEDLGTFSQAALSSLDAQTGVVVQPACFAGAGGVRSPVPTSAANDDAGERAVEVFVRAQIGNYEVAVIGSKDASATAEWLKDNDFRISPAMLGFIELYTQESMKFLALKLLPDKSVNDITPFKLTLPGDTPSIPLRLSAVAAEPEMGIVVWILGDQRYEPANAEELQIDNKQLRYDFRTGRSNWLTLVARGVDEAQGRGFVVEDAQPIEPLRQLAQNSFTSTPQQQESQKALLELFANTNYLTRLYTRLSPEEMTFDPMFKRSSKGDVARFRSAEGDTQQCGGVAEADPCDFVACGALGLCRSVMRDGQKAAACACADGATARTTFTPTPQSTFASTVSCIDQRLSFLNPGDRDEAGSALPDPCAGVDCGGHGSCVAMNMTATCACERGYVAEALVNPDGSRSARCLIPMQKVPDAFYNRRTVARDPLLPVGRDETAAAPTGLSDAEDPVPEGNMSAMAASKKGHGDSCTLHTSGGASRASGALLALALSCLLLRRRRAAG